MSLSSLANAHSGKRRRLLVVQPLVVIRYGDTLIVLMDCGRFLICSSFLSAYFPVVLRRIPDELSATGFGSVASQLIHSELKIYTCGARSGRGSC